MDERWDGEVGDPGMTSEAASHGIDPSAIERTSRRIERVRGLPGGRAVVGALLVTAAAVAVFAAYLSATAGPTTAYLVARDTIEPGTRFADRQAVLDAVSSEAVSLSPSLADRAIPSVEVDRLVGHVVIAPLGSGDLVLRSAVVDDDEVVAAQTLSFRIAASDAVAGMIRPGERIDILATYGSGDAAYTAYVVRGVSLLRVLAADGGAIGPTRDLTLTVAIRRLEDVQALSHAVSTATILVTRSAAGTSDGARAPGPYRPSSDAPGPLPEPPGRAPVAR